MNCGWQEAGLGGSVDDSRHRNCESCSVTQGSAASVVRECVGTTLARRHGREIYQTATVGALLDGVYDEGVTIRERLRHGNFGLGRNAELVAQLHEGVFE
jgi:hypothetical protein